jgi:arylsulfatase A-like enzyme
MYGPDTARKNWHVQFSMPNGGTGYRDNKEQMRPHEVRAELNAYEAAITHLDARVGAMLDTLAASGALDNTIVVVTSDHGEHFGEHGEFDHGTSLYPQVLHVPLVIYAPGRVPSGVQVRDYVTLRDLPATIEQLALGQSTMPGTSLAAYWDADSVTRSTSAILASFTIADRKVVPDDVRHGAWAAVVRDTLVIEHVGGQDLDTEVYDLSADPLGRRAVSIGPNVPHAVDSARSAYRGLRWRSREVQRQREQRRILRFD